MGVAFGETERKTPLVRCIAQGLSNRQIAARPYLSLRTVETVRSQIQHKIGVTNRRELVRYAQSRGLIGRA